MQKLGIDVSKKTIKRDVDDVSRLFFVYEEELNGETRYRAKKLNIDNIAFTIPELISLYFLQQVIKPYQRLDVGKTANALIKRVIEQVPPINQSYIDFVSELFIVSPTEVTYEKYIDENHIQTSREAIEKKYKLKIEYSSFSNNELTSRIIEPYILEIREGCYHLIGFCNLRNEVRDFRVSRIKKLEITDETFERPDNFYEQYIQNRFEKMTGDEEVTLKIVFEGQAAKYIRNMRAPGQMKLLIWMMTGSCLKRKQLTHRYTSVGIALGADAEVIEPEALKFEVMWEAMRMAQKYNK